MKRLFILIVTLLYPLLAISQEVLQPARNANNGKWGYLAKGEWAIPAKFELASSFSEGVACVRLNGKYGFINSVGEAVISYKYDDAQSFIEGFAVVMMNGKCGFIDHEGNALTPFKYDAAMPFKEGMAPVMFNGKWGFIDRTGYEAILCQYEDAKQFSNGLAQVLSDGISGFVDEKGKWYYSEDMYVPPFSGYAKRYVEAKINQWQAKGKYEKTVDWRARVNAQTQKQKVIELTKEAEKLYIEEMGGTVAVVPRLSDYDADNEVFLVKDETFGDLLVPVPIAEAPQFEQDFYKYQHSARYFIDDDKIALAELAFTNDEGKRYSYNNEASLNYVVAKVDYEFQSIDIDAGLVAKMNTGTQNISYAKLDNAAIADVDKNIPKSQIVNDKTFAVIIANELYKHEEPVPYAKTDGESVRNYCVEALGIPQKNIHFCTDATLNDIRTAMRWITDVGNAFGSDAKILFYYAGHGVADDQSRSSFLLPTDGVGKDPESGYAMDKLYAELGDLPVGSVFVLLDSCFSGAKRDGDMLVASRGVAIRPKTSTPLGNMVVFSATTGEETAALYEQKGHGLFTYFLLKKLQESGGDCTFGELVDFVEQKVNQESIVVNKRTQTPTVAYSVSMADRWSNLKLK